MKLLLDTHAFLWFVGKDARLSLAAESLIADPNNEPLLSLASCWEIAIKHSICRLSLPEPYEAFMQRELPANDFGTLAISHDHIAAVAILPFLPKHNDPFDRLLIAQAIVENIPFVSNEALFDAFPITRLW